MDQKPPFQPNLHTARLTLEAVEALHAPELFELFSDKELHTLVPFEAPTLEAQRARCIRWAKRQSPDQTEIWFNWIAREKKTKQVVGHFQTTINQGGIAVLGYVVARRIQNQGFATEGVSAMMTYLSTIPEVTQIQATSDTRNIFSHKLVTRLGLVQTGLIKDADFFKGKTSDEFVFSKNVRDSGFSLRRVDLKEETLVQEICADAPTFLKNTEGISLDASAGHDVLTSLPPGSVLSQKHVLLLQKDRASIGVADLIDGYPEQGTAFLGLFLLRERLQRQGWGKALYLEVESYVRVVLGSQKIRLAVVDSNPVQPFWKKMGFALTDICKPHQGKELKSLKRVMEKHLI